MPRHFIVLLAIALAALGLAAGLIASPAHADAPVALADLPGLGYTLGIRADLSQQPICSNYWVLAGNGAPETLIGDPQHAYCQTDSEMQARIDALLAAYPSPAPAPATTTDAPVAPAAPATTTDTTASAPVDAPTVTDPVPIAPATADPAPAVEPVTAPVDPAPTVTVADSGSAVDQAADAALSAALASGADDATAALIARSAGLNAEYGL